MNRRLSLSLGALGIALSITFAAAVSAGGQTPRPGKPLPPRGPSTRRRRRRGVTPIYKVSGTTGRSRRSEIARPWRLVGRPPPPGTLPALSRRATAADRIQQQLRNRAVPRTRGDSPRGDSRSPHDLSRRASARRPGDPPVAWRLARTL